jgi:hypothetical protein
VIIDKSGAHGGDVFWLWYNLAWLPKQAAATKPSTTCTAPLKRATKMLNSFAPTTI